MVNYNSEFWHILQIAKLWSLPSKKEEISTLELL